MVTSSVSSPKEELNFFNFLLYSHLLPWSQSPSSRDWKYLKHIPGLCQHIANLSQGSFQETCPRSVAMNVYILIDTLTRIFVYLGVETSGAAVEVRPHQPVPCGAWQFGTSYVQVCPHNLSINNVPCGGVEKELLPFHLLPNWPSELLKQLFVYIHLILSCSTVSWEDFWYSSSSDHPLRLSLNVPVSLFPVHIYVPSHSYHCHLQNGRSLLPPMFCLTPSSAHISTYALWFLLSYQLNPWWLGCAQELRPSSLAASARHPSGQLSFQMASWEKTFCSLFLFSLFHLFRMRTPRASEVMTVTKMPRLKIMVEIRRHCFTPNFLSYEW